MAWVLCGLSVALLLGTLPLLIAVTAAASQTPTVFPLQLAQQLQQRLHLPFQFWCGGFLCHHEINRGSNGYLLRSTSKKTMFSFSSVKR